MVNLLRRIGIQWYLKIRINNQPRSIQLSVNVLSLVTKNYDSVISGNPNQQSTHISPAQWLTCFHLLRGIMIRWYLVIRTNNEPILVINMLWLVIKNYDSVIFGSILHLRDPKVWISRIYYHTLSSYIIILNESYLPLKSGPDKHIKKITRMYGTWVMVQCSIAYLSINHTTVR